MYIPVHGKKAMKSHSFLWGRIASGVWGRQPPSWLIPADKKHPAEYRTFVKMPHSLLRGSSQIVYKEVLAQTLTG